MPSEHEEILSEMRDDGIVPEEAAADDGIPVEAPADEPGVEIEAAADEDAPEVEEPEGEEATAAAEEPAAPEDPRDAGLREMREEIAALKRERAEEKARLEQAEAVRTTPESRAEAELLARDPDTLTAKEFVAYNRALVNREMRRLQAEAETVARRASSEEKARGLFSKQNVGEGYDYDAIVEKHIREIEKTVPEFGLFMEKLQDRATAQYTLGLVLELQAFAGGDPVKAAKLVRQITTGQKIVGQDLLGKLKAAEKKGVSRVKSGGGASAPTQLARIHARRQLDDMTDAEFAALERRVSG